MSTNEIEFIKERFDAVDERMNLLQLELREIRSYQLAHPPCPSPGSCVPLAVSVRELLARNDGLNTRVMKLESWQAWITGIGAAAVLLVTVFGPAIRKALNIE